MDFGREHFHLTAQSSYSIGERANPHVTSATLPKILRHGGYKSEGGNSPSFRG